MRYISQHRRDNTMKIEDQINYWLEGAERDLPVAESLLQNGHYAWCLFVGHLVLEKTLKAHYVKNNGETPPRSHDLTRLSEATDLELSEKQREFLFAANSFHIESRYSSEKLRFYENCTAEFAAQNLKNIKEFYQWLKSNLKS